MLVHAEVDRLYSVAGSDLAARLCDLAVDEHVDVAPDDAALIQDPAFERAARPFEVLQRLVDGRAVDIVLPLAAGELLQLST